MKVVDSFNSYNSHANQTSYRNLTDQYYSSTAYTNSMYMNLVERCFGTCVNNFRSKHLDKHEAKCLENCSERYIKSANRTGLRFQEHQAMQMKRAQDMANGGGAGVALGK